jgi:hypothetical protein
MPAIAAPLCDIGECTTATRLRIAAAFTQAGCDQGRSERKGARGNRDGAVDGSRRRRRCARGVVVFDGRQRSRAARSPARSGFRSSMGAGLRVDEGFVTAAQRAS